MAEPHQNEISLKNSFDNSAATYDSETNTLAHQVDEYVSKENIKQVLSQEHIGNILDAGGGTGKFSVWLAELGYSVTLMDISSASLEVARRKISGSNSKIDIIQGNVEQTSFTDGFFDFILSQGPLSYTPDPSKMVVEMSRILAPNGLLWIDFYNCIGWAFEAKKLGFKTEIALSDEKLIQMPDWDYPARLFSIRRVSEICRQSNLHVENVFGNHILLNSLPLDYLYSKNFSSADVDKLKKVELALSHNSHCVGVSKTCQILARKIYAGGSDSEDRSSP